MDTDADLRIYHENRLFVYMYTGTLYIHASIHIHTHSTLLLSLDITNQQRMPLVGVLMIVATNTKVN